MGATKTKVSFCVIRHNREYKKKGVKIRNINKVTIGVNRKYASEE